MVAPRADTCVASSDPFSCPTSETAASGRALRQPDALPYSGAGGYLKITRLHEPKGALFIEYHLIYSEPQGWFSGADPLTTKLPAIIQAEVRTFRRELSNVKK